MLKMLEKFFSHKLIKTLISPNAITISRIFVAPPLLFFLLVMPQCSQSWRLISALIFGVFALTDLLDGYLARKNHQVTDFGKCFDHIADKVLVIITLIALVYLRKAYVLVVGIIVLRELIISGVREFLGSSKGEVLSVSFLGKVKTVFQKVAIFIILLAHKGDWLLEAGNIGLFCGMLLSLYTMYQYLIISIKRLT